MRTASALRLALQVLTEVEELGVLQAGETHTLPSIHIAEGVLEITVLVQVRDRRPGPKPPPMTE